MFYIADMGCVHIQMVGEIILSIPLSKPTFADFCADFFENLILAFGTPFHKYSCIVIKVNMNYNVK